MTNPGPAVQTTPNVITLTSDNSTYNAAISAHIAGHFAMGVPQGQKIAALRNVYTVTAIGLGDSRSQYGPVDIATNVPTAVYDDKYLSWVKAYSGGRIKFLNDSGVSGQTSTQIYARVQSDAIAFNPTYCFLWMAANDAPNGFLVSTSFANISATALALFNAGVIPVIVTESPHVTTPGGSTGQYADYYMQLNALLRSFAAQYGFPLADAWNVGVNPASITGATNANYLEDTIHPAAIYCRKIGLSCWNAISADVTQITDANAHTSTIFDYVGNNANSRQVLPNPLFGSSGGTAFGTGAVVPAWITATGYTAATSYVLNAGNVYVATTTGTSGATAPTHTQSVVPISDGTVFWRYVGNGAAVIPANWFAGPTVGAATGIIWRETRADNKGFNLCMACTGAAANEACEINSGSFSSAVVRGDTVTGEMLVSLQNAVNVAGVYITLLTANTGGSTMTNTFLQNSFGGVFYDQSDFTDLGYVVQPIIIPNDGSAVGNALLHVRVIFNGVGSCLVKVGGARVTH
jgi:lysophospholipase L1-like esterase